MPALWTRLPTPSDPRLLSFGILLALALTATGSAAPVAAEGVTFHELVPRLAYERAPSATKANAEALQAQSPLVMDDFIGTYPVKPHGAPGVAILDFDGDGDLDLYVTNGPGAANSLYTNRLVEEGHLRFVDVAEDAGVEATDQDSTGVCFGDLDNDGDPDLYVLGRGEPNRLFENLGGGTFREVPGAGGAGGGLRSAIACSFADFDGDGLLDVVVANNFDMATNAAIFLEPYALNERNQLFRNVSAGGALAFADDSDASGVSAAQDITWAIAAVDLDGDGAVDILEANDNGGIPFAAKGGVDRGLLRFLKNDGGGTFTDVTAERGLDRPGDWMGLAFGDFDADGTLDFFASNTGDYFEPFMGLSDFGEQTTRWFLQRPDGTFADPGVGDLVATPFGWGTSAFDYDNDGDTDLVYYGGLDAGPIVDSNPGALLENQGGADFRYDRTALLPGAPHELRIEHGVAVGDLDGNGFPDIVSVSAANLPVEPIGPIPYPMAYGSPFDGLTDFFPSWLPGDAPGEFVYAGVPLLRGDLAIELNSGGNGNRWIEVATRGSVGEVAGARVNRDGIGAVVRVTPLRGQTAVRPVLGGSSYASQDALAGTFGLGRAPRGTVEVAWPGGVRNRLYGVRRGERVVMPEIPCSFADPSLSVRVHAMCVARALHQLVDTGVLDGSQAVRFFASAVRAHAATHRER